MPLLPARLIVPEPAAPAERFRLYPDQEEALKAIREAYERGVRRQLVVAPTGSGKCLSGDTLVVTDRGLLPIARVADVPNVRLLSHDGRLYTPTAWLDNGTRDTVIVTTEHGLRVEGTPNHPVLTVNPSNGTLEWKCLEHLKRDDILALQPHTDAIFPTERVILPEVLPGRWGHTAAPTVLDEPWALLMGFLTADGSLTVPGRVTITKPDESVLRFCEELLEERGHQPTVVKRGSRCASVVVCSRALKVQLEWAGLHALRAQDKTIPWTILCSPKRVQAAYLSGLFAGDGHVHSGRTCIEYGTSSYLLARHVQLCLLTFGVLSTLRYRSRTNSWRLFITGDDARTFLQDIGIWLERKRHSADTWPQRSNPNKVVPCIRPLVRDVNAARQRLGYPSFHHRHDHVPAWKSWAEGRRAAPVSRLRAAIEEWKAEGVDVPPALVDRTRYAYSAVAAIAHGHAHVYDITVPETHSFIGNGVVSHNTVLIARVPELISDPRMIYVAHREELLQQTLSTLRRERPDRPAGLERAARHADLHTMSVVASIQSLWRPDRLARYRSEDWPLMAMDEAHRAVAESYLTVLRHFRFLSENDESPRQDGLLLGTTATSRRTDEIGLSHVFDEVVFHRTLREMVEAGRLVPLRGFLWRGDADLDTVDTAVTHGERDYDEEDLARVVDTPERNRIVVDATRHIALGEHRPTLVFAANIQHSNALAECFREAGVRAASVHGRLPMGERAEILDAFRRGELDVLVNCELLIEGVDIPQIAAVVMARPTQSALLFQQAVGRGTRKAPGKTDCIVIDIVDNTKKHAASLVTLPTLFGLPPHFNLAGHAAHETARQVEEAATLLDGGFDEQTVQRIRSPADIPRLFEEVDVLRIAGLPASVSRLTRFAWQRLPDGTFALPAERDLRLEIAANTLGHYEIRERPLDSPARKLAEVSDLAGAFSAADGTVFRRFRDRVKLLDRRARWRTEPATVKQLDVLRAPDMTRDLAQFLGIRELPKGLTKGQVQILIDRVKALRRQGRL